MISSHQNIVSNTDQKSGHAAVQNRDHAPEQKRRQPRRQNRDHRRDQKRGHARDQKRGHGRDHGPRSEETARSRARLPPPVALVD